MKRAVAVFSALMTAVTTLAHADQVTITPSKDNTLYQNASGAFSNGKGVGMFAGATAGGGVRRALVAFDVAAAVPANATINSVTLTLAMNKTSDVTARAVDLHKVLADWGEGTSDAGNVNDGGGTASTTGDATWVHTFFPSSTWSAMGGDFDAIPSASVAVGATGSYTWGSTTQMVADVQDWLDNASANFGWLLQGVENQARSAKRFATREDLTPTNRPSLTVDYTPDMTPTVPTAWGAIKALYR